MKGNRDIALLSCVAWEPRDHKDSKQSELRKEAKITMAEAQKTALATFCPRLFQKISFSRRKFCLGGAD